LLAKKSPEAREIESHLGIQSIQLRSFQDDNYGRHAATQSHSQSHSQQYLAQLHTSLHPEAHHSSDHVDRKYASTPSAGLGSYQQIHEQQQNNQKYATRKPDSSATKSSLSRIWSEENNDLDNEEDYDEIFQSSDEADNTFSYEFYKQSQQHRAQQFLPKPPLPVTSTKPTSDAVGVSTIPKPNHSSSNHGVPETPHIVYNDDDKKEKQYKERRSLEDSQKANNLKLNHNRALEIRKAHNQTKIRQQKEKEEFDNKKLGGTIATKKVTAAQANARSAVRQSKPMSEQADSTPPPSPSPLPPPPPTTTTTALPQPLSPTPDTITAVLSPLPLTPPVNSNISKEPSASTMLGEELQTKIRLLIESKKETLRVLQAARSQTKAPPQFNTQQSTQNDDAK